MPLVFRIAGSAPPEGVTAPFVAEALVWIAVVGGVVGAVHGLVLVRLVVPRRLGLAVPPADRRRDR
jgi:hypothetical protein